MSIHREIEDRLYEFYKGELPEKEYRHVEVHLASCDRCAKAAAEIRELLSAVPISSSKPSEKRPEQFWNSFAFNVNNRILREERNTQIQKISLAEYLRSVLVYRPRALVTIGVGLAVVALIVFTVPQRSPVDAGREQTAIGLEESHPPAVQTRLGQYLRKSQILMVGLMNMKPANGDHVDLSVERSISRELIEEARYLREQELDERAQRLIQDMQKILLELANIEEQHDLPEVEILRAGIRQENLLFKLRMGEQFYTTTPTAQKITQTLKGESL